MRRKINQRYIIHTMEHLGVFGLILMMAMAFGFTEKWTASTDKNMLAQTSSSVNLTDSTTTIVSGSTIPVVFSSTFVRSECISGNTIALYHFSIEPQDGGYILLTTPNGQDFIDTNNGKGLDRKLPIGSYSWAGNVRSGFYGTNSGEFTVENICTSTLSATTETSSTTLTTTNTDTTNNTLTPVLVEVSFSAQPGLIVRCTTGSPLTPVFLLSTQSTGGNFLISSNSGMSNAVFEWGEYYLPNGKYHWEANIKSGFIGVGDLSGYFELNKTCPILSESTVTSTTDVSLQTDIISTTTSIATTSVKTATSSLSSESIFPAPLLRLFVNNSPVTAIKTFDNQMLELRIVTILSTKATLFVTDGFGETKELGVAEKDDLLSRENIDVWTYIVDTGRIPNGTYRFFAKVARKNGSVATTEKEAIIVRHADVVSVTNPSPVSDTLQDRSIMTNVQISLPEKEAILDRVSDPASCTNESECRIYCSGVFATENGCISYVQFDRNSTTTVTPSFTDGILPARIAQMLADSRRRPKEIPDIISSPDDFRRYCSDALHADVCIRTLVNNEMSTKESLLAVKEAIIRTREGEMKIFEERIGARVYIDTDDDGITDYDEVNLYQTDPNDSDTDNDGFPDGAELLARTNPRGGITIKDDSSPAQSDLSNGTMTPILSNESILHDNPKISGVTEHDILVVNNVTLVASPSAEFSSTSKKKLRIEGKALPNMFVNLYIFSEPIVVTVKADESGSWTYTFDKELPDGTHQVYSAITNSGGRIIAKSNPLPFVKEAGAVSLSDPFLNPTVNSAPGFFDGPALYAMISVLIGVLGVALTIIGFVVRQKKADARMPEM